MPCFITSGGFGEDPIIKKRKKKDDRKVEDGVCNFCSCLKVFPECPWWALLTDLFLKCSIFLLNEKNPCPCRERHQLLPSAPLPSTISIITHHVFAQSFATLHARCEPDVRPKQSGSLQSPVQQQRLETPRCRRFERLSSSDTKIIFSLQETAASISTYTCISLCWHLDSGWEKKPKKNTSPSKQNLILTKGVKCL